jgi:hypothetical protein
MDLAMVNQEQGETLRKYMRRFFDKRATVVDITDKEVIDLFQDGLYHRRTFEDFGRRRPKSIPHLKEMITSWADEEDKANAKYDAIRGKNKPNAGSGSSNNGNQGGRSNNNNYSGPNCVHHPVWRVLLHDHVLRVEERRRHLSTSYLGLLQEATQQEHRSLRG